MCVNVTHFVLEAFSDSNYQIVDDGFDSAKSGDIFASAVM